MMLRRSKLFIKQYKKLPVKVKVQFNERLELWLTQSSHPQLRNHPLTGSYQGYWSFNVSGDVRALYYFENEELVIFALIGSHSQLYK
jgi:addiction module RelE/StbE family toxin